MPDGQCCLQHAPCKPTPSLRGYRGRFAILAAGLVLALIAAFAIDGGGAGAISSVEPGALSGGHQNFTRESGCATCHKPHGASPGQWLQAIWSPNALSRSCESCHAFNGPATTPHNETFKDASVQRSTECTMCHTEHKGMDAKITSLKGEQCNACHDKRFESFSQGHPRFSKDYPSRRRTAIIFNHTSHLSKHFQDKRYASRAPTERCIACHNVTDAARNIPIRPFKESCAQCHESQIPGRDMVIFTLPEFEKDPFDKAVVVAACGRRAGAAADEEFESVSTETLPPAAVFILDLEDGEDSETYAEPVRDLIMGMIENGNEAFVEALSERGDAGRMLSGLSPELLRGVGCAWAANVEYEAPEKAALGGWFADELSLRYRPVRHGDPVAMAWLGLAAAGGGGEEFQEAMLSRSEGPGACAKCHSVGATAGESKTLRIAWSSGARSRQRHVKYSHTPHLNLLGPGASCETCHKIDAAADYDAAFKHRNPFDFSSNFKSIENKTCAACHAEGQVRQECTLCHEYHNGKGFKRRMTTTRTNDSES